MIEFEVVAVYPYYFFFVPALEEQLVVNLCGGAGYPGAVGLEVVDPGVRRKVWVCDRFAGVHIGTTETETS